MLILKTMFMNSIMQKFYFLSTAYPLALLSYLITILVKGLIRNRGSQIITVVSIEIVSILILSIIRRRKNIFIITLLKEISILFFNLVIIVTLLLELDSSLQLSSENFIKIFDITCTEVFFWKVFLSQKLKNISLFCFTVILIVKFEINGYNLIFMIMSMFCLMINVNHQKGCSFAKVNEKVEKENANLPFELDLLFEIDRNMKLKLKTGKFKKILKETNKFKKILKETNEAELNFISKLQKAKIEIKKEYVHLPDADAIISELYRNIPSNNNLADFQDFLTYVSKKEDQTYFCLATVFFQDEEKSFLVFLWKKDKNIFFQIKRDVFIHEAIRLKIMTENYSRSIYYTYYKLRNFLNCIANLELLKSSNDLSSKVIRQELIKPAVVSSKLILNLANHLFDITQIEAHTFKLNNIEFDLCSLLEEAVKTICFQAKKRGIKVCLNFDCSLRRVQSDSNRTRNALKYTKKGFISLSALRINSNQVQINVKDSGVGIKEENIKKFLQEFPQIQHIEDNCLNLKGVGLGLIISNKIANFLNKLEGGIEVTSKIDIGSVFSFKLYDLTQRNEIAINVVPGNLN